MIFGAWKSRSEAPKSIFLQMVDSQELQKFSRIAMALIFFPVKAGISYFLNMYKTELKTELQRVNFVLTEISSIWILLEFWRCFWPQGYMSSVLSSVHVCRNVRISYLFQSKAQKWSFKWYSVFQVQKTWNFQIFKVVPSIIAILGAPFWAPKSQKCYHNKLQKKLKILHKVMHHLCSKCTSFEIQWFDMKWY